MTRLAKSWFLPLPTTGMARTRGPHIAAQWRLPTNPIMKAARSILVAAEHERCFDVVLSIAVFPVETHFPQTALEIDNADLLHAIGGRRERDFFVEPGIGRPVKVDRAFNTSSTHFTGQGDADILLREIVSDDRFAVEGAGARQPVDLRLILDFVLVIVGADELIVVAHGKADPSDDSSD